MANVLIIDDDPAVCAMLAKVIQKMDHRPQYVHTLKDGVEMAQQWECDVVFLDVRLPDGNGLDYIPLIKRVPSEPEVIIITAVGDPDGAELAINNGAWDYMPKRTSIKEMTLPLVRALQFREEKKSRQPLAAVKREGIIGVSDSMNTCFDLVAQAAASRSPVLITGETGTGKEIFAQAIHINSSRADKKLVVVDCAALPENLVESTLFGHEKGAFTGADRARQGVIKQADGGTLFLDEVGELPPTIQKAFLRVLQENRYRPIGAIGEVESDFRLIAATNRELDPMVENGSFRKDLLFRIRSQTISLPPLRERIEDIKPLALHYINKLCERQGSPTKGVSPDFWDALIHYEWPGNIRELIHTIERALAAAFNAPTLFATHLPTNLRLKAARAMLESDTPLEAREEQAAPSSLPPLSQAREKVVAEFERKYLGDLMVITQGSMKKSAEISGVSRQRLHDLLRKYELK